MLSFYILLDLLSHLLLSLELEQVLLLICYIYYYVLFYLDLYLIEYLFIFNLICAYYQLILLIFHAVLALIYISNIYRLIFYFFPFAVDSNQWNRETASSKKNWTLMFDLVCLFFPLIPATLYFLFFLLFFSFCR